MLDTLKKIIKSSPIPFSKNHLYDLQTKKILKNYLRVDSNCIDVGCHKGEILDLMLKSAPQGLHFGIEPIPGLYHNLKEKYKNNEHCVLKNYAASDSTGTANFNHVVSNPSYSGLIKRDYDRAQEQDETISVKTALLDDLIDKNVKISLIKIDVEGAEYQVLSGAKRILSKDNPIVIFEHGKGASNHYGTTPDLLFTLFETYGMGITTLGNFLKHRAFLNEKEFREQYEKGLNYYFIASSL